MKFTGRIVDRKLKFSHLEYLKNYLRDMPDGQHLMIEIDKRKRQRSNEQNAMYWGYILSEIAKETGHTSEELHEVFKRKFLPRKYIKIAGKNYRALPSTAKENTKEFTEYIEKIKAFAAQELGIEWV